MDPRYTGHILVVYWWHIGDILVIYWWYTDGDIFIILLGDLSPFARRRARPSTVSPGCPCATWETFSMAPPGRTSGSLKHKTQETVYLWGTKNDGPPEYTSRSHRIHITNIFTSAPQGAARTGGFPAASSMKSSPPEWWPTLMAPLGPMLFPCCIRAHRLCLSRGCWRSSHIWTIDVLVIYWWYTGDILVIFTIYTRGIFVISKFSKLFSKVEPHMDRRCTILVIYWWYTGDILVVCVKFGPDKSWPHSHVLLDGPLQRLFRQEGQCRKHQICFGAEPIASLKPLLDHRSFLSDPCSYHRSIPARRNWNLIEEGLTQW